MAHGKSSQTGIPAATRSLDAVVIGAGLSGLYALYRLRKAGLKVRAYDDAEEVGGTWWWNCYPGARVDTPSAPFYAYIFSADLAREWDWAVTQPDQASILAYLKNFADRFDLRGDIQLRARIQEARFCEETQRWVLKTSQGERIDAQFLIAAVGSLSTSYSPDIPGIDGFAGELYHTGHWPHDAQVKFTGQHVGVIGTGSSGVQVIPVIAREAERLTVFQRTPQYVLPGHNRDMDPGFANEIRDHWNEYRRRIIETGRPFPASGQSALAAADEQLRATYESAWEKGGMSLREAYKDHLTDPDANFKVAEFVRSKIRQTVRDQKVAQQLLPDYYFGTKRLILGHGYYETYNRENVTLINVREDPIVAITRRGVRTARKDIPLDMLVLATGYDALTGTLMRLNSVGRGGLTLAQKWERGIRTYLGMTMAGFPNFFMIHGPQSPSVKFHTPLGAELQSDWIADCISYMRTHGLRTVEPTAEMENKWGEEVKEVASGTLYPLTDSWYTGANIPGKPREFMVYLNGPGYHQNLRNIAASDYPGFSFKAARTAA